MDVQPVRQNPYMSEHKFGGSKESHRNLGEREMSYRALVNQRRREFIEERKAYDKSNEVSALGTAHLAGYYSRAANVIASRV